MKIFKLCLMLTTVALTFGTSLASAASDTITLKVTHFMPSTYVIQPKVIVPWCDKIEKESGGKLKCQIFPSMQLGGTPSQLFGQARDGVADVVWTVPTYQAGIFLKSEVFELPFMVKSSERGSQALWDYIQKNSLDEFKGTKLIFTHLTEGAQMHFGKKSVKNLEDLKGLKMRAAGRIATKTIKALGAIPVQMPASAVSEAIAKSVIDGAGIPWEVCTSLKLQEICKTSTESARNQARHSNTIMVFAMNQAKYDSLPANLKKVIDNNSGRELSKSVGKLYDSITEPARKIAVDRHNTINVLSDAEYLRWVKATEHVSEEWVKEINAKGKDGNALLQDAKNSLHKYNDR